MAVVKNPLANAGDTRDVGLIPGSEDLLEEEMPEKLHGQRSLMGYSPWGHKESDTTEHTHARTHNIAGAVCLMDNDME